MDITYTKHGDYYYPDLELPPQLTNDIGRFGRMRKKYLREASTRYLRADADGEHSDATSHRYRPRGK